jgi:anti-sigma factor (TIGR02949 family)
MMHHDSSDSAAPWTCTDVLVHLYEFIDGALPARSDERMREHIARCGHCRPAFAREREFLGMIRSKAKVEQCPEEVRRRILEALGNREPGEA